MISTGYRWPLYDGVAVLTRPILPGHRHAPNVTVPLDQRVGALPIQQVPGVGHGNQPRAWHPCGEPPRVARHGLPGQLPGGRDQAPPAVQHVDRQLRLRGAAIRCAAWAGRRPAFSWRDPPPQPSQTTNAPISRSAHVDSSTDACRAESWASARTLRRPYWNRRHDFVWRQDANPSRRSHTVWNRRVDIFGTTGHVRTWWWCGPRKRWWRVRAGELLSHTNPMTFVRIIFGWFRSGTVPRE